MDEKEFDDVVRKALTPKLSKEEIGFLRKTEVRSMRKSTILKPVAAMAACAALVLGAVNIPNFHMSGEKAGHSTTSSEVAQTGVMEKLENAFTVKVYAAEKKNGKKGETAVEEKTLTKEAAVPVLSDVNSFDATWDGDDNNSTVSYCEAFPVICEGKNIEKITYTINKGAFQIFSPKGSGFIREGKKSTESLNVGAITPEKFNEEDEEGRIGVNYDEGYYTSFTVSPDFQTSEDVMVNICDQVKVSKKAYKNIFDDYGKSPAEEKAGRDEAFGNLTITCEVTYRDGTTGSAEIAVGTEVMKLSEVIPDIVEQPEKDMEAVVTTFRMK